MALFGQKAENEFVGVNTGILDQYSSAMGQAGCALQLDCRDLTSENVDIADRLAGSHLRHARRNEIWWDLNMMIVAHNARKGSQYCSDIIQL